MVRHKPDAARGPRPRFGLWSSVLMGVGPSGNIAHGTDANQARSGPIGYTLFASGFFAVACYASVLRSRRRLERERSAETG
jgi:hypothetical protein